MIRMKEGRRKTRESCLWRFSLSLSLSLIGVFIIVIIFQFELAWAATAAVENEGTRLPLHAVIFTVKLA